MRFISSRLLSATCAAAVVTASCRPAPDTDRTPWVDPSPHRTGELKTAGLRLQYLAWGDHGDPVVFVHGSGDSPHYFDDLAPALATTHRVIAPARRGHGQSEVPSAPFSLDDLTDDLVALLDTLHIDRATLIGFSYGGNEITRFAERYPARVSRLVYLDAAFEQGRPELAAVFTGRPMLPEPKPSDMGSLAAFRTFAQAVWYPGVEWNDTMEAVLRDFAAVGPDGRVSIPSDRVAPSMTAIETSYHRDYSAIQCPVLVIVPDRYELAPVGTDGTLRDAMEQWHAEHFVPYQRAMIETLERGIPGLTVVRLRQLGHNALPVTAHAEILAELQSFLTSPAPVPSPAARP